GEDIDGDGLCDGWEASIRMARVASAPSGDRCVPAPPKLATGYSTMDDAARDGLAEAWERQKGLSREVGGYISEPTPGKFTYHKFECPPGGPYFVKICIPPEVGYSAIY